MIFQTEDCNRQKNSPKLNMAMPRPASDNIEMDLATMAGI